MLSADRLARAERFLPDVVRRQIYNPQIRPNWIAGTDHFWYQHETPEGVSVRVIDAATGAVLDVAPPAFSATERPGEVMSPDGTRAAFCRDHDLWVRDVASGGETRLTQDGAPHHAYAKSADMNLTTVTLARRGISARPVVLWSPDSSRMFTSRLDERAVRDLPLVQHVPETGATRPILYQLKIAHPGDVELPMERHLVLDAGTGAMLAADPTPRIAGVLTCIEREEAWWSRDGGVVWYLDHARFERRLTLRELTVATGVVRDVVTEEAATFLDVNLSTTGLPNIRVLEARGEVVWFSQRDGWAHLYLYDLATGALKRRLTEGEWVVRDLLHVDEVGGCMFFLAGGVDPAVNPYFRTLCSVGLDGAGFAVLTPEPHDHTVAFPIKRVPRDLIRPPEPSGSWIAPSGRYFVHTHSTLEEAPASAIRRIDGSLVAALPGCTLAPALGEAWQWPRLFQATAADEVTALYGAIWLPTDFDPARRYPVIDYIYPGPQRGMTPTAMLTDSAAELFRTCLPQQFAELGFVVVNLDGRGTPLRAKAFHDASYGRLDDPGTLADHVAVLKQLVERHDFMDIDRLGIMGHSGGGYASVRAMLEYPEFFRAAVASSGNHDQQGYSFSWTEKYQGPLVRHADGTTSYDAAANRPLAHRLKGHLMLATGDMDDNVHPALTLQLIAALIAADRDFEFLVIPNADHGGVWSSPWFRRRAMAFLMEHLGAG